MRKREEEEEVDYGIVQCEMVQHSLRRLRGRKGGAVGGGVWRKGGVVGDEGAALLDP